MRTPAIIIRLPISCPLLKCSFSRKYESSMTNTYVNVSITGPNLMSTLVYAKVVENSTAKDMAYAVMTRQLRYSYIQLLCSILALCLSST